MKKSFLIVGAALALGLAACGGDPAGSSQGGSVPSSAPTAAVPTEDGKVTFYLELGTGSIEFKEYESMWLVGGGINGWATGYDSYELINLEGTNYYYAFVENLDVTASQGYDYSVVLGYNRKANMSDSFCGLQWIDGRKSNECEAAKGDDGLQNLKFEWADGQDKVFLGTHTFNTPLPAPAAPLRNVKLSVTFEEAVPDYGTVQIYGSFDGWTTPNGEGNAEIIAAHTMTPSEDRKTWTLALTELVANEYVMKVLVEYTTAVDAITWNAIAETPDNTPFTVLQSDGDNCTIDVLSGDLAHFNLPDPNATLPVTITVTGEGHFDGTLYISGNFTGWSAVELEPSAGGEGYEWNGDITAGKAEFGVMSNTDWSDKAVGAAGANASFDVELEGHTALMVTFTVDFSIFGNGTQEGQISTRYID